MHGRAIRVRAPPTGRIRTTSTSTRRAPGTTSSGRRRRSRRPNAAHNCPNASNFFSDYVKYSFTVGATGWYKLSAAGSATDAFSTRVDDINKGLSPTASNFWVAHVVLVSAVHLTAGTTHVLTIELLGVQDRPRRDDDRAAHRVDYPAPRVVSAPLTKDEVVIADAVVDRRPQFGAVPNKPTFNNRLRDSERAQRRRARGRRHRVRTAGRLHRERCRFRCRRNVTLRGDWSATTSTAGQTILAASVPAGDLGTRVHHAAGTNARFSHIERLVPEAELHHARALPADHPVVRRVGDGQQVTLFNSDQGVFFRDGSAADITGLKATCLSTCILDDGNLEYVVPHQHQDLESDLGDRAARGHEEADDGGDREALHHWTTKQLTGIHLFRNDNLTVYGVIVTDAMHGIVTTASGCNPGCGTYGSFSKISASLDRSGDRVSARPEAGREQHHGHRSRVRRPGHRVSLRAGPDARPHGTGRRSTTSWPLPSRRTPTGSPTTPPRSSPRSMPRARGGGGTVYLPSGTYLVSTHLVDPDRCRAAAARTATGTPRSPSTPPRCSQSKGRARRRRTPTLRSSRCSPEPECAGVSIRYPNQGFGSAAYPIVPFPYTVAVARRGDLDARRERLNGYQIVDLATYRSDGFVVKNLWATAFLTGVNIGGGSSRRLARAIRHLLRRPLREPARQLTARVRTRTRSRRTPPSTSSPTTSATSTHCDRSAPCRSTCTGISYVPGHAFLAGPTNSTLFASSSDSADSAGFVLGAGTRISFVGLLAVRRTATTKCRPQRRSAASPPSMTDALSGSTRNSDGIMRQGGTLHVFPENLRSPAVSG